MERSEPGAVVDAVEAEAGAVEALHHRFESGAASVGECALCVGEPCPSLFGDRVADEEQVHGSSVLFRSR